MNDAIHVLLITDETRGNAEGELRSHARTVLGETQLTIRRVAEVVDQPEQLREFDLVWVVLQSGGDLNRAMLQQLADWEGVAAISSAESLPKEIHSRLHAAILPYHASVAEQRMIMTALLAAAKGLQPLHAELQILRRQCESVQKHMEETQAELHAASQMQRCLQQPELPKRREVAIDVLYQPAGQVSGDSYLVVAINESLLAFALADAVGHGVPAAMLTMFIDHVLWQSVRDLRGDPSDAPRQMLISLNRQLVQRRASRPILATAITGTLHLPTGTLQVARAGHPPPLLLHSDGTNEPLRPEGPLLGMMETEAFNAMSLRMQVGDRLLAFTDGFEQAFALPEDREGTAYVDELTKLCRTAAGEGFGPLRQRIAIEAGSFHQRDDLTALLMEYRGAAARA